MIVIEIGSLSLSASMLLYSKLCFCVACQDDKCAGYSHIYSGGIPFHSNRRITHHKVTANWNDKRSANGYYIKIDKHQISPKKPKKSKRRKKILEKITRREITVHQINFDEFTYIFGLDFQHGNKADERP